jgi:hypothetical protein
MTDNPDVWLDSDIEALEESIRAHPAKGFKVPKWTTACPGCGRGVNPRMLEVPHWRPEGEPVCVTCRKRDARWFRSPAQRAASEKAREARKAAGVEPHPGFLYE